MATSYPDRTNARGIWRLSDIYKNKITDGTYPNASARGMTGGGSAPGTNTVIDFLQIMSTGNAADFGDLSVEGYMSGTASNHTRGVFGSRGPSYSNVMDYVHIATQGNAADFGDSTVSNFGGSGLSNSTRGVFGGGYGPGSGNVDTDVIDFITIATTGNAADFGNLTAEKFYLGGMQNKTRGLFGGGYNIPAGDLNVIDVIEIATTGNASDFGDLTSAKRAGATMSGNNKCIFAGGFIDALTKDIDTINPNSLGNAVDFGELTVARKYAAGCSTYHRGVAMGGLLAPGNSNVMDFITMESAGNATDFGDLTVARGHLGFNGISDAHGGLDIGFNPRAPELYSPTGKVVPRGGGAGDLCVFAGGNAPYGGTINFFQVSTTGNAQDFGDSTLGGASARDYPGTVGGETRAMFFGGDTPSKSNLIDYVTFAHKGNAADFGDLNESVAGSAGCGSSTRGIMALGGNPSQYPGTIEYITIASVGNATDFGNMSVTRSGPTATSSTTRGVLAAGQEPSASNVIDYVTIGSTGNATDFGDLTGASIFKSATSSSTRGVFMGGTASAHIEYITIGSAGNATDFGDLTNGNRASLGGGGNSTRGVCFGGNPANTHMEYITIASTGDSTDFGDLLLARIATSGASNGHGGLS